MSSSAPMISVRHLWKVFGPNADKVIGTATAELSRSQLRAQTGNTIAVRDVSFDVAPGGSIRRHGSVGVRKINFGSLYDPFNRTNSGRA